MNPPLMSDTHSPSLPFEPVLPLGPPLLVSPSRLSPVPFNWFVIENSVNDLATSSTRARFHTSEIHLAIVA